MNPLLFSISILLGSTPAHAAATEPKSGPNIVFVLVDDLGYGEPKCNRRDTKLKTPNIDRLAAECMRITDAHSAAVVCTPTRYGVLTGRYPSRIGQFGVLTTYSPPIIPKTRLAVASLLKQNGYDTECIGKWHLGEDNEVSGANPEEIEHLTALMRRYITEGHSTPGARQENETDMNSLETNLRDSQV